MSLGAFFVSGLDRSGLAALPSHLCHCLTGLSESELGTLPQDSQHR